MGKNIKYIIFTFFIYIEREHSCMWKTFVLGNIIMFIETYMIIVAIETDDDGLLLLHLLVFFGLSVSCLAVLSADFDVLLLAWLFAVVMDG